MGGGETGKVRCQIGHKHTPRCTKIYHTDDVWSLGSPRWRAFQTNGQSASATAAATAAPAAVEKRKPFSHPTDLVLADGTLAQRTVGNRGKTGVLSFYEAK